MADSTPTGRPIIAISTSSFGSQNDMPLQRLRNAGIEVRNNPFGRRLTEDEVIAHLDGVVGLIAGLEPLNARVFSACPTLRAIARVGIGMSNVDIDAAKKRGIAVSNTPDGPTDAVAELTITALLALFRGLVSANEAMHQGQWQKAIGSSVRGSNILVVGLGRIGRRVAEIAAALGATVHGFDPFLSSSAEAPAKIAMHTDLNAALGLADAVLIHASGEACIIGAEQFAALKPGAFLLNAARGGLVDHESLIGALKSDRLAGAWIDTFWQEPYDGPLKDFPQVLLTPHVGTYTRQCRLAMESGAVENILRDLGM